MRCFRPAPRHALDTPPRVLRLDQELLACARARVQPVNGNREVWMAGKRVVLYFDRQEDALHFTLAAGSVLAGDAGQLGPDSGASVIEEMGRATRINFHTEDEPELVR
jgi:hypothetical protein